MHLGLVGHQLGERAPEPNRFGREVSTAAVALVEDQVDDREHRGEPVGQQVSRRDSKRDTRNLDLALGADEPLCHGRLGDEEGARDLLRLETAERSQRERHLGIERERRVAAREDQLEPLVRDRRLVHFVLQGFRHLEPAGLLRSRPIASEAVDRAVTSGGDEPRAWVGRRPLARPALGGDRERLLGGLLGELEVAEEADQAGEDTSPLVSKDLFETCYHSTIGRTSIAPPMRAAGMRAANSIAASRSSASKRR